MLSLHDKYLFYPQPSLDAKILICSAAYLKFIYTIKIKIKNTVKLTEEMETILETGNLCISNLLKEVHSFVDWWSAASLRLSGSGRVAFASFSFLLSGSKKSSFPRSTTSTYKENINRGFKIVTSTIYVKS